MPLSAVSGDYVVRGPLKQCEKIISFRACISTHNLTAQHVAGRGSFVLPDSCSAHPLGGCQRTRLVYDSLGMVAVWVVQSRPWILDCPDGRKFQFRDLLNNEDTSSRLDWRCQSALEVRDWYVSIL